MITVEQAQQELMELAPYDEWYSYQYPNHRRTEGADGVYTVIESEECGEGDWAGMESIIFQYIEKFSGDTQYFRKEGLYRSFDGTDWDEYYYPLTEVKAQQKMVTVWEEIR